MDDNFTPHGELVNRIRPFVHRYVKANPHVLTLWMSGRITLPQIHDIMSDFWDWIRRGAGVELFTNSTQRHIIEAFEDVLHEMSKPPDEAA